MYSHISLIRTFAGSANIQIPWRYNEISTIVANKCYGHVPFMSLGPYKHKFTALWALYKNTPSSFEAFEITPPYCLLISC